jgi:hypothetical protein
MVNTVWMDFIVTVKDMENPPAHFMVTVLGTQHDTVIQNPTNRPRKWDSDTRIWENAVNDSLVLM